MDFAEYFWGERNDGFKVLYENMKNGAAAAKEMADFLREHARLQEESAKSQLRIVKQLSAAGACGGGGASSFGPLLAAFKAKTEKLASIHAAWAARLNDLVREVVLYAERLAKTHKKVKDDESATSDAVKAIQDTTVLLLKSKEVYKQRCLELEKLKRETTTNKDTEKAELKFKRAQEDYKVLVERYSIVRDDFETKMTQSARKFQEVEKQHLVQMRMFVENYCQIVDNSNNQWGRVQQEFQIQLAGLTVENLLEQFMLTKHTGLDKPGPIEFEEEIPQNNLIGGASIENVSLSGNTSNNSDKISLGSGGGGPTSSSITRKESSGRHSVAVCEQQEGKLKDRLRTWSARSFGGGSAGVKPAVSKEQPNSSSWKTSSFLNLFVPSSSSQNTLGAASSKPDLTVDEAKPAPKLGKRTRNNSGPPAITEEVSMNPGLLSPTSTEPKRSSSKSAESSLNASTLSLGAATVPVVVPPTPEEKPVTRTASNPSPSSLSEGRHPSPSRSPLSGISVGGWTGFLRRKQKKDSKKKRQSGVGTGGEEDSDIQRSEGEASQQLDVDEEGYSRQPSGGGSDPWADFNRPKEKFYSSSDDSDDEETTKKKAIRVEIKPVNAATANSNGAISASVDELQKAVGGLELVPPPLSRMRPLSVMNDRIMGVQTLKFNKKSRDSPSIGTLGAANLRRSQSQSLVNGNPIKLSQDLEGLTLHPIDDNDKSTKEEDEEKLDVSNSNKEVRDIFSVEKPTLPAKQRPSSVQREIITNSLIALPRPPSRHSAAILSSEQRRSSPAPKLSIARQTQPAFSESANITRQSPLTLSQADVIPLAVAFQEVCHACFRGADESQCQVRLIGDMMISFPAGIVNGMAANPNTAPLIFRIKNAANLEAVVPNRKLIDEVPTKSTNEMTVFEFDMSALKSLLKLQHEQNPKASYFNIDILKYQIKAKPGAGSCPLQMVAYWKCNDDHTDLRMDYKYNGHAMAMPQRPILNFSVAVPVDGGVTNMQSKPNATWMPESNRALWKFPSVSSNADSSVGSLRGRFELSSGPGNQSTIAAQFNCEGTSLSGVDIDLVGPGYRLSLVKKRFVSGKYVCEGDPSSSMSRYAVPPSS